MFSLIVYIYWYIYIFLCFSPSNKFFSSSSILRLSLSYSLLSSSSRAIFPNCRVYLQRLSLGFPDKVLISISFISRSYLPWSNHSSTSTQIALIFSRAFSHVQLCHRLSSSSLQNLRCKSFNPLFPALPTFPHFNLAHCYSFLYPVSLLNQYPSLPVFYFLILFTVGRFLNSSPILLYFLIPFRSHLFLEIISYFFNFHPVFNPV